MMTIIGQRFLTYRGQHSAFALRIPSLGDAILLQLRQEVKMATILLVDDDENILRLCKEELIDAGYEVITASKGKDAIEKIIRDVSAGSYHIDLVVLDINMPGVDGKRVLQELKGTAPFLPVIVHTAYDYTKDDFVVFGSDEYVTKSSDLTKLINTIKYLLKE